MTYLDFELQLNNYMRNILWQFIGTPLTYYTYTAGICGISRHSYEQEYAWHSTVRENYDICMRATTAAVRHNEKNKNKQAFRFYTYKVVF